MPENSVVSASIDLSKPRVLIFQARNKTYAVTCRRVTDEDWDAYYAALTVTSQRDGKDTINSTDFDTPRRVLAERVMIDAEGYKIDGDAKLTDIPGWQKLVPLAHRLLVGAMLASINTSERDEEFIYPDGEPVYIDAIWTASDEQGSMHSVVGLKHVLRTPTEEQYRLFAREASRTRILGGERTGTTLYPGSQSTLADLYDQLIVSVEGYTTDGTALAGKEAIAREMDKHHKVVVAQQVFRPNTPVFAKTEGNLTK